MAAESGTNTRALNASFIRLQSKFDSFSRLVEISIDCFDDCIDDKDNRRSRSVE